MNVRIRKAWLVKVRGYDGAGSIVFAPSAGKARYETLLRLREVDDDATFSDISVHRERGADVRLPPLDPVTLQLSAQEKDCLLHAFGYSHNAPEKAGFRNHYCTAPDDPPLVRLMELGLMDKAGQGVAGEGLVYFLLTGPGRQAALSMVSEYAS